MDTAEFIMASSPNNISTSADIATKSTTTTMIPASTASNIIKETVAKYSGIKRPQLINAHNYHHHYLSPLHLHVGPDNGPELQAVHKEAYPTAIFYVTTILALYACGLLIILIHYMNSYYGKWAWSLNDVWDELKPTFILERQRAKESQKTESDSADQQPSEKVICSNNVVVQPVCNNSPSMCESSKKKVFDQSPANLAKKLQSHLRVTTSSNNEAKVEHQEEHQMSCSLDHPSNSMASNRITSTESTSLLYGQTHDTESAVAIVNEKKDVITTVDINYYPKSIQGT